MTPMDTTRAMPPVDRPRVGVRLVVVEGLDAGAALDVPGPRLVGTSDASDLKLADPTVSRRHLTVSPDEVGLRVRDEDSRNGTWLGEARVHEAQLPVGARLRIGGTWIEVRDGTAVEATAEEPAPPATSFGRFIGSAPALGSMYRQLSRAAASEATILLEGESGTGKELLSEAIHEHSPRADGPFVVVDCGAVPESLIESELFGHERGAFTGAVRDHAGAFEQASGGTVFLDEIGELPLSAQTRLLRVLDRRHVRRVGADRPIDVDVRIVAATNRNLDREVEDSRFRLDLFHRLAVVLVRVPPLRDRPEDLDSLARTLVRSFGGDEALLTEETLARMRRHRWPGNVRELRNHVERLVLFGEMARVQGEEATSSSGADPARAGLPYRQARALALDAFTSSYADDMLGRHGGNVSHAARAAGIARRHFQRLKQGT